jgi:hypothetical protein
MRAERRGVSNTAGIDIASAEMPQSASQRDPTLGDVVARELRACDGSDAGLSDT